MEINVPKPLIKLSKALGAPIYIVGGYVRNALASLPPSDIDICGPFLLDESNLPAGFKIISVYKRMGIHKQCHNVCFSLPGLLHLV